MEKEQPERSEGSPGCALTETERIKHLQDRAAATWGECFREAQGGEDRNVHWTVDPAAGRVLGA